MTDTEPDQGSTSASDGTAQSLGAAARVFRAVAQGCRISIGTIWFLLKVIVPVSLAVALLDWFGVLARLSQLLEPLMTFVGLPGEAAFSFISSIFLNIYAAIAVAASLSLDLRAATILAVMCLTAHNMIVETAVMKKTGSSALKMPALRILVAIVVAFLLNLILPAAMIGEPYASAAADETRASFVGMIGAWAVSTGLLSVKIVVIVLAVMIVQKLLREFRVLDALARIFAPLMRVFGLSRDAAYLWLVANVVGYSYGAGVIAEQVSSGGMKRQDADLFNHHAAVCHSLVEDSALYAMVGIPLVWITLPRLALAVAVTWLERLRRRIVLHSFKAGTL
jgi:hypothetical protein